MTLIIVLNQELSLNAELRTPNVNSEQIDKHLDTLLSIFVNTQPTATRCITASGERFALQAAAPSSALTNHLVHNYMQLRESLKRPGSLALISPYLNSAAPALESLESSSIVFNNMLCVAEKLLQLGSPPMFKPNRKEQQTLQGQEPALLQPVDCHLSHVPKSRIINKTPAPPTRLRNIDCPLFCTSKNLVELLKSLSTECKRMLPVFGK
jgi:hypothetical protein